MTRPQDLKSRDTHKVNDTITAAKLRLIDAEGEMIGVLSRSEALKMAEEQGLDLVEIVPNSDPPVCKLMDFGKFKYEQQKKKAEAKKKQKVVELKEIQIRPMIGEHDFMVKCNAIERFIQEGHKVKVCLRFRGRELSHQEIGFEVLTKLQHKLEDVVKVEQPPKLEGKQLTMFLVPKASV